MDDEARLLVTLKDGVKRITFNAPERRNAVDRATSERLLDVVESEQDTAIGSGISRFCKVRGRPKNSPEIRVCQTMTVGMDISRE